MTERVPVAANDPSNLPEKEGSARYDRRKEFNGDSNAAPLYQLNADANTKLKTRA